MRRLCNPCNTALSIEVSSSFTHYPYTSKDGMTSTSTCDATLDHVLYAATRTMADSSAITP